MLKEKSEIASGSDQDEGIVADVESSSSPLTSVIPTYTMQEVSNHCEYNSCWIVISDKVYDVTQFLREHPGGEDIILENAGRDATVPFSEVQHSADAQHLLRDYFIGNLVQDERIKRSRHDTYTC